jgi:hypothetical protein
MENENPAAQPSDKRTQLFTVRLWREPMKEGRMEIRGKAQHVLTGEVYYFREWAALGAFMTTQMETGEDDPGA